MKKKILIVLIVFTVAAVGAQTKAKYNYAAQSKFIPKELGKIYLGMPFDEFAKQIDLKNAEIGDTRFTWLQLTIPFERGNLKKLSVKIHGLTEEDKEKILRREIIKEKDEGGYEFEREIERLIVEKIPAKGFVYAMYIDFKPDFDLRNHVIKTYGKDGDVRKSDDEYHFYDIQWTKKTSDGLLWLIRSFHEGNERQLLLFGRINGTEWGLDN